MKVKSFYLLQALFWIFLFASCQKEAIEINSDLDNSNNRVVSATINAASSAAIMHPGRTLAANCFQCHGTNGYGLEHLAGKPAKSISDELIDMKKKNPRSAIMNVHATAFTLTEINLIADFFSKQ